MKFKILNQGVGVVESSMPKRVESQLAVEIEDAEGEVVKVVSESSVFYARIEDGVATVPVSELRGRIGLSLARSSGTVPLGGFVALPVAGGVELYRDGADCADRLGRVEREVSDAVAVHRDLLKKYKDLEERISHLFDGYNF